MLLVGVGSVTRLLRFLTELPKTYTGEVVLGVETSTLDAAGEVTARHDMAASTLDDVRAAVAEHLTGHDRAGPADGLGPARSAVAACTSWPARASRSSGRPGR